MPTLEIAHIREQGQDMIIAALDDSFEQKTEIQRRFVLGEIQLAARDAGLRGIVVVIWQAADGEMRFMAPRQWQPFLRSIDIGRVLGKLNRTLTW
ncbi:hypothetical protein KEU06_28085 [Pseudaminobacter sp. 19-2017]|uniref:Uncharacterized protein n=1 Tax=Pseudaminobacter soli (ex Zhang et al. 2022) TaxID=2831468 RepID=A0A942EC53_9HYPH|nr:hypothetical protein [Pseudaminobacter soli]MBS3652452.1 hypothetical protein [Pseudaminobacter soli]